MFPADLASRISVSVIPDEARLRMVSKELGLRYIEAAAQEDLDVRSVGELLDTYGIIPAQMHGPSDRGSDIGNLDPEGRKQAVEKHKRYLACCPVLGVRYYVLHPGGLLYGTWDDARKVPVFGFERGFVERLVEVNVSSVKELADEAGEQGVKIAFENGPLNDPTFLTIEDQLQMISQVERDNVGMCIDVGHANVGMKVRPADLIRRVGPMVWALHLHDNDGTGDQHLPPGRGNIDWVDVVGALGEVGYAGFLNIEFNPGMSEEFAGRDYVESVKPGIALLRRVVAGS